MSVQPIYMMITSHEIPVILMFMLCNEFQNNLLYLKYIAISFYYVLFIDYLQIKTYCIIFLNDKHH